MRLVTVRRNVVRSVPPSASVTVTVTRVAPDCPGAGVSVTLRFMPDPPKTIPSSGKRLGSEVEALRVRSPAGVSASSTVKGSAPLEVPASIVRLVRSSIEGLEFPPPALMNMEETSFESSARSKSIMSSIIPLMNWPWMGVPPMVKG